MVSIRYIVRTTQSQLPSSPLTPMICCGSICFMQRRLDTRILSVYKGQDYNLIPILIDYYYGRLPQLIIDATWGLGRFWKRVPDLNVVGIDLRPTGHIVADNRCMPFRAKVADIIVYDPPHMTDVDTPNSSKIRLYNYGDGGKGHNVSHLFPGFFQEATRILKDDGILICKIADQIHDHRSQVQFVDMVNTADRIGFYLDDYIIKVRPNAMVSSKWKRNLHARKVHSFFIIFKKRR